MAQLANTPSHEPDLKILAALERVEGPLLLAVALVAVGELLLWNVPWLSAYGPAGWDQMPSFTAGGALLATVSLTLSAPRRSVRAARVSMMIGLFLMLVPLLVLLDHAGIYVYHVFKWPVPPPPQTAIAFGLAASSLPFIRKSCGPLSGVADFGAVSLIATVLFLFGAWSFDVVAFVGADGIVLTSPQTLFCLSLLAFVIGSRRAAAGRALAILVSTGIGSQITRKVLAAVLVSPFIVFRLIAFLNDQGIVSTAVSRAAAAPLVVLATLSVLGWMGWHTNRLERQLRQQSITDGLTGVLNRRGFETVAEYMLLNARRTRTALVVFYFDLDGLKQVNDTLGHDTGSDMLKAFARILAESFRKNDIVARVGGDEFIVLAAATSNIAADLLVRLKRNVDDYNTAGPAPFVISYSDGHAAVASGTDRTIDDLVAEADAMMYQRKARKKAA